MFRTRRASLGFACFSLVLLAACEPPAPDDQSTLRGAAPAALAASRDVVLLHAIDEPEVGLPAELVGRLEPAPPNSDADRVLVLEAGLPALGLAPGARVLDAQFADDGVLVVGADHVLRHYSRAGVRELDRDVNAPISVAAGRVVYSAGGVPDATLRQLVMSDGSPQELAPGVSPAWSPVLSADGEEVLFTASVRGLPQLLHRDRQGAVYEVEWSGRTPSSPVAPQWRGRHLIFQDEEGVGVLDVESGDMVAEHPGAKLLPDRREGATWIEVDGLIERIEFVEVTR